MPSCSKAAAKHFTPNRALAEIMIAATADLDGIPEGWMHLLEAREEVAAILELHDLIDLIIPRGGNELVQTHHEQHQNPRHGACRRHLPRVHR